MIQKIKKRVAPLSLIIALILFASCKTLLAPEYDKAIVEGITATSEKTMKFLEANSAGTYKANYNKRENEYNELIGAFDALKLQTKARPLPKNVATEKINEILKDRGNDPLSSDYPSAFAFEEISKTLRKMKEKDQEIDLKPGAMVLFKGQIEVFLDQAITYESFLKR